MLRQGLVQAPGETDLDVCQVRRNLGRGPAFSSARRFSDGADSRLEGGGGRGHSIDSIARALHVGLRRSRSER
jgi:hypothetical protein